MTLESYGRFKQKLLMVCMVEDPASEFKSPRKLFKRKLRGEEMAKMKGRGEISIVKLKFSTLR